MRLLALFIVFPAYPSLIFNRAIRIRSLLQVCHLSHWPFPTSQWILHELLFVTLRTFARRISPQNSLNQIISTKELVALSRFSAYFFARIISVGRRRLNRKIEASLVVNSRFVMLPPSKLRDFWSERKLFWDLKA